MVDAGVAHVAHRSSSSMAEGGPLLWLFPHMLTATVTADVQLQQQRATPTRAVRPVLLSARRLAVVVVWHCEHR